MAARHRIIEVGIVLLERGAVVESWSSLVNPGVPHSAVDCRVHRHRRLDGRRARRPLPRSAREVRRRLDGRLFVAHNARFDYGFLRAEFRRLGQRYSAPVLCTVRLSRLLSPEAVAPQSRRADRSSRTHVHGAAPRARRCGSAAAVAGASGAGNECRRILPRPALVCCTNRDCRAQLPPELADDLPDAPGRLRVSRRARGAVVRRQGQQHPQPGARALRRRASAGTARCGPRRSAP